MTIPAYNPVPVTSANVITFITTDPLGVGFAAIRAASPGADAPLISAATAVSASYPVPGPALSGATFFDLLDGGEYGTFTGPQLASLDNFLILQSVTVGSLATQTKLNNLLADYPKSLATVQAHYTRPGHAWEYYFGAGQTPTTSQLDAARNLPPSNPNF